TDPSHSVHFCEVCGKDDPCSTDDVCYALKDIPATDRIYAGIKAEGVEQYAALFADTVNMEREHNQQFHKGTLWFAKQLREGGDK
ncbi:hypothetical protein ACMWGI_28300, partial [Klebsiella pneumoniae]